MRRIVFLAVCVAVAGCAIDRRQPDADRMVAAFEVELPSQADRGQFLSVLRAAAEAEGMHLDTDSKQELEGETQATAHAEITMHAAVWRGPKDDDAIALVTNEGNHLSPVWIMFFRGKDATQARRFRQRAMRVIRLQWPNILSLPIMPSGAIPLPRDLVRTPSGYIVKPSEASKYELRDTDKQRN